MNESYCVAMLVKTQQKWSLSLSSSPCVVVILCHEASDQPHYDIVLVDRRRRVNTGMPANAAMLMFQTSCEQKYTYNLCVRVATSFRDKYASIERVHKAVHVRIVKILIYNCGI